MELQIPLATRFPSDRAAIYSIDNFLSVGECSRLCRIAFAHLSPSATTSGETGIQYRRSKTAHLGLIDSVLVADVDRRVSELLGLSGSPSEPLQAHVYQPGDEFKPHTDYFKSIELKRFRLTPGQRVLTVLIYVQEPDEGGETVFTEIGLSIRPRQGSVLIWSNLALDGELNPYTRHASAPVIRGQKVVLTKWFNQREEPLVVSKDPGEELLPLTRSGFVKRSIPNGLWRSIIDWYTLSCHLAKPERAARRYLQQTPGGERLPSKLLELPGHLRERIKLELTPIVEDWCSSSVRPTWVYGARIYRRGVKLLAHRDRLDSHILGVTMNICQSDSSKWPIRIQDHVYRWHSISLSPGQMILFESAKLLHERSQPLSSDHYVSVFCHFLPVPKS
ncbi:2OG-Fe(II) oxygenase [Acidovorax sp. Root217]|uniref:prolyl hydroxylase family protein n=1 Tax=Acidovorax sp. Root217 TaxID=1736492 RepID=UPI0009E99DBA